jgi:hypothetical protein
MRGEKSYGLVVALALLKSIVVSSLAFEANRGRLTRTPWRSCDSVARRRGLIQLALLFGEECLSSWSSRVVGNRRRMTSRCVAKRAASSENLRAAGGGVDETRRRSRPSRPLVRDDIDAVRTVSLKGGWLVNETDRAAWRPAGPSHLPAACSRGMVDRRRLTHQGRIVCTSTVRGSAAPTASAITIGDRRQPGGDPHGPAKSGRSWIDALRDGRR